MEARLADDGVTQLLDSTASDRIQILSAPIQLPGVCGLCGTSRTDDREYIDIGLWLEYYGHFYFCTFCMQQMVNRLGGLTPEQADKLQEELDQARKAILDFQEQKAAYDGAIDTLRNTGLFSGVDLISDSAVSTVAPKQDKPKLITKSERNEYSPTESSTDTTESLSEQGSDGVSSIGSNDLESWL